ncbi:MAG TPA: Uma2 family endonuclease [Vicinamibacteria bacterium]|nr:Uma2 family endonuclease [Vicinamibacteria bacterium]
MASGSASRNAEILGAELRRIRADEYHRMIEAGVLDEDERVELLEGMIVAMSPQKERHAIVIERLCDVLWNGRFLRLGAGGSARPGVERLTGRPEPGTVVPHGQPSPRLPGGRLPGATPGQGGRPDRRPASYPRLARPEAGRRRTPALVQPALLPPTGP